MTQQTETQTDSNWRLFFRKHWAAFAVFTAAAVLAVAGAVYVFVWFTGNAQSIDLVPSALSLWSMNHIVLFMSHAAFWEFVLIGIPVAIGAIAGWAWWKRIPEAEKPRSAKHSRGRDAGGAISPLFFIAFAIKVYIDGNWHTAIANWNLDYVVGSMVTILLWAAAIIAIPAIIALVWWINHERKQP